MHVLWWISWGRQICLLLRATMATKTEEQNWGGKRANGQVGRKELRAFLPLVLFYSYFILCFGSTDLRGKGRRSRRWFPWRNVGQGKSEAQPHQPPKPHATTHSQSAIWTTCILPSPLGSVDFFDLDTAGRKRDDETWRPHSFAPKKRLITQVRLCVSSLQRSSSTAAQQHS